MSSFFKSSLLISLSLILLTACGGTPAAPDSDNNGASGEVQMDTPESEDLLDANLEAALEDLKKVE